MDTSIQFTVEEAGPDGSTPFLDTLITPQPDGAFTTKVFRKPTHTDQYLQWNSNHNLASKYSVINTLTHRARTICFTPELLNKELKHLEEVLRQCKYPRWAINKILQKQQHQQDNTTKKRHNPSYTKKKCHVVVPYTPDTCEIIKNICQRYGIQVYFKEGTTLKNLLVSPKDKDSITKKSSVIYWFRCDRIDHEDKYIGESSRTFGERYKGHLKVPSPIFEHKSNTGHTTSVENFKIIGREGHILARTIKEAMYIKVNNPTLSRNNGNTTCHTFRLE